MDITNQASPSVNSQTHQYSFGLLDDNYIQDLTLENDKTKNIIKNKPPIPTKTLQQKLKQLDHFNKENNDPTTANFNMDDMDNADATVETLHLNESDLKELNNEEFTFDVDDDDDEEEENENHALPNAHTSSNKPDESSNKFDLIDQQETQFNDFLMDESANILRNSIDTSSSSNSTTQHFNYDKLDEINLKSDQAQPKKSIYDETQCSELNRTATNEDEEQSNDYLFKPTDQTQNMSVANDPFSAERINQLVLQSVERVKRMQLESVANDNYLSMFGGGISNLDKAGTDLGLFNKMSERRDSDSTVKSINSHFKNMNDNEDVANSSMNKTTNMSNLDSILTTPYRSTFNLTKTGAPDENYLKIDKGATDENRLTLNSFYFKPSATNNFTVTETPKARPDETAAITESDNGFPFDDNNLVDEMYSRNMFRSTGALDQLTTAPNPFEINQHGLNSNFDDIEFKSGGEFIDQIEKDEAENRKEFASNDLSVAADTTSSNGSGDSLGSNEKWWNNANNLQQMSKLDLSNVSYLNELNATSNSHNSSLKRSLNKCDETETGEHDNTKKLKQKVDVFDYFSKKSGLPEYLASRDVGVDFNSIKQDEVHDKTICDDEQTTTEAMSKNEIESNEEYDSDNITLSVSKSVNLPSADNFSFTFNSSETGEFIQKKLPNSSKKKISPFQLSKMLPPQNTGANKTKTSISLKTIGEELDRVQNRLATNATDGSSSKPINEPLLSSSLKVSKSNSNLKSALSMDETISSINSSDMTAISSSHKNKAEHGGINPKKVNLSSTATSSVSTGTNQATSSTSSSKNKPNSGSLTSTPSKMVKSVSESSSLSTISTTTINKSSQDNTNQLFSQDSFISSIPERANDSTLIGNHRHHHHHLSKHKQKSTMQLNAQSKLKKQRNAEIQTSPDQHTSSSSTSITTTRSNSNDSKSLAYTKLNDFKNASQEETNNRASISSISSANELSSNQLTTQLSAINSLASLLSQGNSCSGTNAPLIAIFQMPSVQNDATNKSQFESSRNSINQAHFMKLNQNLLVDTTTSANSSSAVTPTLTKPSLTNQSISAQLKPTELPEIDLNAKEIDFGLIAEGCSTYFRLFFKILNLSSLINGFLQVELDDCVNWRIEPTDLDDHSYSSSKSSFYNSKKESNFKTLKKKFNDMTLRARFRKTLSLHAEKPVLNNSQALDCQSQLKFDLSSGYYELFVNLDTKGLKFFKDIISSYDEQFDPCLIKAQIYIYYYAGGNAHDGSINSTSSTSTSNYNKKLIQMIDLRYVLGYAKLKTQANLNEIELAVDEDSHEDSTLQYSQQKKKAAYYKDDIDQTMTSSWDILDAKSKLNSTFSLETILPLSNAGNINIELDCYFSYEENGNVFNTVNSLLFKNYELRLFDSNIYLDHKVKQKSCARLYLSRVEVQTMGSALTYEANKTKLIVEVKPNGFRYELPVHVSFKSKGSQMSLMRSISQCSFSQPEMSKKSETDVKLAASKSILFFGRTLMSNKNITVVNAQENGLVNEFTISNSNDFAIRSQIALIIKENGSSESNENKPTKDQRGIHVYFRFSSEMKSIPKLAFNEQMTSLNVNLEPKESLILKIKFCPPISANSYVEQSTVSGVVKMNITGFTKRFNVHLVGFLKEAFLDVQNAASLDQRMSNEENQLEQFLNFRNIKHLRYSTQLFNTNGSAMNKTYRKVLKLSNFSNTNSKCLVYPVLYDNKLNMEVLGSESLNNEKCYELGFDSDGYMNKFKLLFDMNLSRFKIDNSSLIANDFTNNELAWFELRPNGEFCIVLELTSAMIQDYKPHKSNCSTSQRINSLSNLSLCLFWIEYDINAFCANNFHQAIAARANTNANSNNFVDFFINKLLLNNSLFMNTNSNLSTSTFSLNESNASRINRMSVDSSFNNSISAGVKYNRFNKDDYLRLLRQAIKCTQINMDMQGSLLSKLEPESLSSYTQLPDSLFQPSMDSNDSACSVNRSRLEKRNTLPTNLIGINLNNTKNQEDSIMSVESCELDMAQPNETWSLSTNSILIENFKPDKFVLKNNLLRKKLIFILKYQSACLEIKPDRGELEPMEKLELTVTPRKGELLSRLPWCGNISVWCNKIQKDVRVTVSNGLAKNPLIKSSSLSSSSSSISSMPSIKSSSTPYIATANKLSDACTSLEQGTIISDMTQYTIDSLSLTPLLNASCTTGQGISFANHDDTLNKSSSLAFKTTSVATAMAKNGHNENDITACEGDNYDESIIRILTVKDDAKIKFPPVCVTQRRSIEFELNNYRETHVIWKAYSIAPAFIRPESDPNSMLKSQYSTFSITPQSGSIPGHQKQTIKIEFCPREAYGIFTQLWQLDTRADLNDKSFKAPLAAYNCKLVLTGKSMPLEPSGEESKLSNRILKSKTNINESLGKNPALKTSMLMNKLKESKENKSLMSSTSSLIAASLSTSNSSLSTTTSRKFCIKTDPIVFEDTEVNKSSKSFIMLHNKEEFDCEIRIICIMDPFFCKHINTKIKAKHYIKIQVEFKPRNIGDYTDKIVIKVDAYDTPLSCIIKGKCVPAK